MTPFRKLSSRHPRSFVAGLALLLFCNSFMAVAPAQAQSSYSSSYSFGVPATSTFGQGGTSVDASVGIQGGMSGSFMGCAGIGQFTFITSLLDTSTLISQLIAFAETMAAKFALTLLFSAPQIQAMLDALNVLGNMKFSMFQQSCDLTTIRKQAKDLYLTRCQSGGRTAADCNGDWDNGSFANSSIMTAVNSVICQAENVTQGTARGIMCPGQGSCPLMALLPQTRINLGGTGLNCGAQPTDYGTHDAGAALNSLLFGFVSQATGPVMLQVDQAFNTIEAKSTQAQRELAAAITNKQCATDPKCGGSGTSTSSALATPPSGDAGTIITNFKNSLACGDPNTMASLNQLQAYADNLGKITGNNVGTGLGSGIDGALTSSITSMMNTLPAMSSVYSQDATTLPQLFEIAERCSLNFGNFFDIDKHLALMKQGRNVVESDVKATTFIWAGVIVNLVAKFTIDQSNAVCAQIGSGKAAPISSVMASQGASASPGASNNMQDAVSPKEAAAGCRASVDHLKHQLEQMNNTLESQKDYAKTVGKVLDHTE